MQLHNLVNDNQTKKKRVGRGNGSGHGGTSCKGHKGQLARSGASIRIGFEGGQMPLYRKLPKRGFSNFRFGTEYVALNVASFEIFDDGVKLDKAVLMEKGLISKKDTRKLKILGDGELTKKITVVADKFTKSAIEKIEAKAGVCEIIKVEKLSKTNVKKNVKK